ncbi:Holliday junction resolvase [Rickettsia akari str. Hartford]|uniref:Crossover junction endodeoxyribonuclease RuvC n=1 Tax=Rickettsia akari (strain Hartford) TaxID=293614 RepID=RUVC_RICAH|nr:crossover junction endodeoxyribonuclease RuvC [Rickettsia akari]A8GM81.1 RecName: Full=Crossover junction endodeoxyribonuclease RuvC; AltName: Full=Holliday junction nuclease RuvC; AltName: Full=Holliday junction resolvase RuvC [Rickettsia akari str. Hartford]ABV74506.1 Holliday junction resolvase [Rickettsia akari str. Hartford]
MIVLGIDPALGSLGWAVVARQLTKLKYLASGIIKTNSKDEIHNRLACINSTLEKVILEYQPNMAAIEETFVNTNSVTSLKLGYARGAIMSLCGRYNLDIREFKPNTVKKTVTGYGHAEKDQILHMIKLLLPGTSLITNSDEADAIAIAYTCHVMRVK